MASTVKDAILRGRKTVETVVEEGRKKVEDVVEGGLNTVETVVEVGLNTVETVVVKGRQTVESAVSLGRKTVEHTLLTRRSTMQAAVLHGREDIRIEQVPVPKAAPGELIVRVGAALTCGTDLKVFRRGYHARMIVPPALFGHELAGTVVEAGEGVTDFAPGDRVVALNSAPCGQCYFCARGQENLCDDLLFNNGAYAEFIRIPARIVAKNTLHVPDHVPLEHAALTEPLACAVHGFEDSHPHPGDTVAVIGGGPLGLMILHVAALAGCEVIAIVKHDGQVEAARQLGAAHVVQTTSIRKAIRETRALTAEESRRGHRDRSRRRARGLAGGGRAGAQGRHGELLWRMRAGNARHARHQSHSLQRHHPARHLPSHSGHLPQGAGSDCRRTLPGAGLHHRPRSPLRTQPRL